MSRCRNFAASSSHDSSIKFYDISQFVKNRANFEADGEEEIKMEAELERQESEQSSALNWEPKEKQDIENSEDFESDDDDDDDEQS